MGSLLRFDTAAEPLLFCYCWIVRHKIAQPTMNRLFASFLLIRVWLVPADSLVNTTFQPKDVITVEAFPSRMVFGSLSMPLGAPWCQGMPGYWLVGHQPYGETPWCLVPRNGTVEEAVQQGFEDYDFTNSTWIQNSPALLDIQDPLNDDDGRLAIDRHQCVAMDVNEDGVPDILCGVGANKGTGHGYNEVYLTTNHTNLTTTNPLSNGTANAVVKVLEGHGLHKYTTMRNRLWTTLRGADGSKLLFMATKGVPRKDGQANNHKMFRQKVIRTKTTSNPDTAINSTHSFHFGEVRVGPYNAYTKATCLLTFDVDGDGLDDIIMCNEKTRAVILLQNSNTTFRSMQVVGFRSRDWRNARVADVNNDGIQDLIVVGHGGKYNNKTKPYLRVFEGSRDAPYFDFRISANLMYELELPFATPDIEILDINEDGAPDIYVVQTEEFTRGTYCGRWFNHREWYSGGVQPPASFSPPVDIAPDVLLVNTGKSGKDMFDHVYMDFEEPGCGSKVERFGNRTLLLAHGAPSRAGPNLLLQW